MKRISILVSILLLALAACSAPAPTVSPTLAPPTPAIQANQRLTLVPLPTSTKPTLQTPAWFNNTVLYEIFPRSFNDSNGDGIGDLKGITQKLDYLKGLGVGALWLTPIFMSPSYHGYDTTDYKKINPDFGTEQDLIDLVNAAHQHNIKIILDFVAGHTSNQNPFFKDAFGNPQSKYANWYRWKNDAHTDYEHFAGANDLPSLNQDNPETRQYLIDVAKYWIDTANIDGYRLDYALGPSHDFWKAFRAALKADHPDFLLLGEVWDSIFKIAPYYDKEMDATFDFPVYNSLMGAFDSPGKSVLLGQGNASSFGTNLKLETVAYNPGAEEVRFLNNHDTIRVASQVQGDLAREKVAAALLLTLPGTPMIYYGEEIGMSGDKTDGDKTIRTPMEWYASDAGAGMPTWYKFALFAKPNDGISVEEEQGKKDSLLETYRGLIALRAQHPALQTGEFVPISASIDQVIAFARVGSDETVIVILNTSNQPANLELDLSPFAAGNVTLTDIIGSQTLPSGSAAAFPLTAAPLSSDVLQLK